MNLVVSFITSCCPLSTSNSFMLCFLILTFIYHTPSILMHFLYYFSRIRTFLVEGFCCHTHNAAWHTLHNIICGTASKLDRYLDAVRNRLKCDVTIFHGKDDEVIPLECRYNVQRRIPRARVQVVENKDHITIVVSRQKAFARELEEIWKRSTSDYRPFN